jgi:hypothetical protein
MAVDWSYQHSGEFLQEVVLEGQAPSKEMAGLQGHRWHLIRSVNITSDPHPFEVTYH